MDPNSYDAVLRKLYEELMRLFNSLPPEVRDAVRAQWQALMAALAAARGAAGASGQTAALRAILEALKRFLAALLEAGITNPTLQWWMTWIEAQLAGLGAGTALTATAIVLVLIAILAWCWSIYEIVQAKGAVAPPIGGPLCGGGTPVATGRTTSSWSVWGEHRAFKNAEKQARTDAQGVPCPAAVCTTGTCRGNCAIINITYAWRVLWTTCTVTYDVYCECY